MCYDPGPKSDGPPILGVNDPNLNALRTNSLAIRTTYFSGLLQFNW